jgi:hypothetical protein
MSKDTTFFTIDMGDQRLVASTSIGGIPALLEQEAAGRYLIQEVTAPRGFLTTPRTRNWGWAIKYDDGRIELEPEGAG